MTDCTETAPSTSFRRNRQAHAVAFEGLVLLVEEAGAEIGGSAAVHNGGTDDVLPLLQREALRDAVVDNRLAIAVDADDLLSIHPPHRSRVRSDGQADAG